MISRARLGPLVLSLLCGLSACRDGDGLGDQPLPAPANLVDVVERALPKVPRAADRARVLIGIAEAEADAGAPSVQARLMAATVATRAVDLPSEQAGLRTRLAQLWGQVGSVAEARAVADEIGSVELAAEARVSLVRALVAEGQYKQAEELARGISVDRFKGPALLEVVRGYLAAGKRTVAGRLVAAFGALPERDEALAEIVGAYGNKDGGALVQGALADMKSPHWRGAAQATLALVHLKSRRRRQAMRTVESIDSKWMKARGYAQLYQHSHSLGRAKAARRQLKAARQTIEAIDDPMMKSSAMAEVLEVLSATQRDEEAERLLQAMPDVGTRHKAEASLVAAYADSGRFEPAARMLLVVEQDALWGGVAARSLARAYAKAGRINEALDTVARIRAPDLRLPTVGYVARLCASSGQPVGPAQVQAVKALLGLRPQPDS